MKASTKAIRFLEHLSIPEGPKAGQKVKLAPFQKQFVNGPFADSVNVAVLSIGRCNAKTVLSAGIALGAVMGEWDRQPRRENLIAAWTRDQARIAFDFVVGFIRSLPEDDQEQFTIRCGSKLEVETPENGGRLARVIASDGKSILGGAPTLAILDERAAWEPETETRSSGGGYTAKIMAARESYIAGRSGIAELTASIRGAFTLWEGGLSLADVTDTEMLEPVGGARCNQHGLWLSAWNVGTGGNRSHKVENLIASDLVTLERVRAAGLKA